MADRKTDPGYCRGCGRVNPCTKKVHTEIERERLEQAQQREGGR